MGFLSNVNNETKVPQSTETLVQGKAKVMGYDAIGEVRAKGATKGKAVVDKGNQREQDSCNRGRCTKAKGAGGADDMRLPLLPHRLRLILHSS